jgi:hypothetical protein
MGESVPMCQLKKKRQTVMVPEDLDTLRPVTTIAFSGVHGSITCTPLERGEGVKEIEELVFLSSLFIFGVRCILKRFSSNFSDSKTGIGATTGGSLLISSTLTLIFFVGFASSVNFHFKNYKE